MKMSRNEKKLMMLIAALLLFTAVVAAAIMLYPLDKIVPEYDIVEINDIANVAYDNWDGLSENALQILPESRYDYAIVSTDGNVLYKTTDDIPCVIYDAARKGCIIYDIASDQDTKGKLIILPVNAQSYICAANSSRLIVCITLIIVVLFLTAIVYWISSRILKPFNSLQEFAVDVAAGGE